MLIYAYIFKGYLVLSKEDLVLVEVSRATSEVEHRGRRSIDGVLIDALLHSLPRLNNHFSYSVFVHKLASQAALVICNKFTK